MTVRFPTSKLLVLKELGLHRVEPKPMATESIRLDRNTYKILAVRPAMGTLVSIAVVHSSESQGEDAIGAAYSDMDQWIAQLNRHDVSSAVSKLNQEGRLRDAPHVLSNVVRQALFYYRLSRGAFDITVKPLVELCQRREPSRREWAEVLELVGSLHLELTEHTIRFKRSGMSVTLDGIAKGYIVDRMAMTIEKRGVGNFLINAGGDIRTGGAKEGLVPWTVAVQDPSKQFQFRDVIHMTDGAVATSGSYERRFRHIVGPETGPSPTWSTSVTVVAPTTLAADALATALFIMDPAEALKLIDSLPGCECMLVGGRGRAVKSRGWKSARFAHS